MAGIIRLIERRVKKLPCLECYNQNIVNNSRDKGLVMRFLVFLREIIQITFRPAFERADIIATIIGVVGGAAAYFFPGANRYVDIGLWLIPLLVFIVLFFTRLFLAPYWLYKQEYESRLKAETHLRDMQKSTPRVLYSEFRVAQLYIQSPVASKSYPRYEVLQVWFENVPEFPTDQSVARDVSAVIEFWSLSGADLIFQFYGQWAETTAPNHVGFKGVKPSIDIPPSHIKAKLMIALKYKDEEFAYPYSVESLKDYSDGRNPNLALRIGNYAVKIRLRGMGIDKEFLFTVENPGKGKSLNLNQQLHN